MHDDIPPIEFGANPNIISVSKKVKGAVPTGEGWCGTFEDLTIQR